MAANIARATLPVPPSLLRRLWIALAAGALSLVITTIQGAIREGFDPWHQAVSALSLGPGGWMQMLNLVVFGAVVLTTVSRYGARSSRAPKERSPILCSPRSSE